MSEIDSDTYVMVFLQLKLLIYINFKILYRSVPNPNRRNLGQHPLNGIFLPTKGSTKIFSSDFKTRHFKCIKIVSFGF